MELNLGHKVWKKKYKKIKLKEKFESGKKYLKQKKEK